MNTLIINNSEMLFQYKSNEDTIDFLGNEIERIIFENIEIDLDVCQIKIFNIKEIEIRKCVIKGLKRILIYNFNDLLIGECIFEGFKSTTLYVESSMGIESRCKIENCTFNKCGNKYASEKWNPICLDIYDVFKVEIENCKFNNSYIKSQNDENIDGYIILLRNIASNFIAENNEVIDSLGKIKLHNY